jgi:hypothetical protein
MKINVERVISDARAIAAGRNEGILRTRPNPYDRTVMATQRMFAQVVAPGYIERAKANHEARFAPLEKVLDEFKDPLVKLRDKAFPQASVICHLQRYDRLYGPEMPNQYTTSLGMYEFPNVDTMLAVIVLGSDSALPDSDLDERHQGQATPVLITELRPQDFSVGSRYLCDRRALTEDFQNVTPTDSLFDIGDRELYTREGQLLKPAYLRSGLIHFYEDNKAFADSVSQVLSRILATHSSVVGSHFD